ncbi:MAG: hypothetical protein LBH92_07690 [Bacteroidales bacterium]|jgi:hypothetical protein|nr:hypothetical protein [Bacteroidales bacterium]
MRVFKSATAILLGCLLSFLPGRYSIEDIFEARFSLSFQDKSSSEDHANNDFHFSEVELIPFEATTRPVNNVKMPVRTQSVDFSFYNCFKNQWIRFSVRSENLVKQFLHIHAYDVNSSHFCFPCRYHVLALREIII